MEKTLKGFKPPSDPDKKHKYGYGMHPDFHAKRKPSPVNLVDPASVDDPELRDIKHALRLDLERVSE